MLHVCPLLAKTRTLAPAGTVAQTAGRAGGPRSGLEQSPGPSSHPRRSDPRHDDPQTFSLSAGRFRPGVSSSPAAEMRDTRHTVHTHVTEHLSSVGPTLNQKEIISIHVVTVFRLPVCCEYHKICFIFINQSINQSQAETHVSLKAVNTGSDSVMTPVCTERKL